MNLAKVHFFGKYRTEFGSVPVRDKQVGQGYASGLVIADFQGPGAVRIIEDFPLDVFTLVDGRPYESYIGNVVKYSIADGIDVPCFSIDDLIEVKRKTLREKDQLDVLVLRRIKSESGQAERPSTIMLDTSSLTASPEVHSTFAHPIQSDEAGEKPSSGEDDQPRA